MYHTKKPSSITSQSAKLDYIFHGQAVGKPYCTYNQLLSHKSVTLLGIALNWVVVRKRKERAKKKPTAQSEVPRCAVMQSRTIGLSNISNVC